MRASYIWALPALLIIPIIFLGTGCATMDGGSGGWVITDSPSKTPGQSQQAPPENAKGQEVAARNHIRSAYRFLQKDKPDHAIRELDKARAKMGHDFWFNYYLGGAFYLKAMYPDAGKSWETAYSYTRDPRLRSRIMTCRSFAEYMISGQNRSVELLGRAIDLDGKNRSAREFLDDLKTAPVEDQSRQPGIKGNKDKTYKEKPGKGTDKGVSKGKKIQDKDQFNSYFLVEMPEN